MSAKQIAALPVGQEYRDLIFGTSPAAPSSHDIAQGTTIKSGARAIDSRVPADAC